MSVDFFVFFVTFVCTFLFLSGDAEEFRVAAINKNGLGEFLYVTPYHVVQGMLNIQVVLLLYISFW